jgi:uncharacterized membrane protein YjfL (UPF0719 family)
MSLPFSLTSTPTDLCSTLSFGGCFLKIFSISLQVIIILAIALSIVSVSWAGVLYILKGSSKEEIDKIHQRLIWSVIGLIIALFSYALIILLKNNISELVFDFGQSKIAIAQISGQPQPPTELKCSESGLSLPSIFSPNKPQPQIWQDCFLFYLMKIFSFLYSLALVLAAIFISWTGVLYILYPEKTKEIHSRLIWGIVGVSIAILSFTIVKLIQLFFLNI